MLPSVKVWSAPAALFQGIPLKAFQADVAVPYSLSDPAQRAFFVRSYDRNGNSTISSPFPGWRVTDAITIEFFTYLSGLAAKVKGASAATITPGNWSFALSGSLTTADSFGVSILDLGTPAPGTTFTLTATHPTRATKTVTLTVGADTTPPVVTLSATPSGLFAPGSTTLTANTSDAVGVTQVEFYRGTVLIATDTSAPYTQPVAFTTADAGTVSFTAKAYDAAGNVGTSAVANVAVGVVDTTPPTISLAANPATVVAPGMTTLQATAADAGGIARVEFHRGTTLLDTVTSPPYQTTVALTAPTSAASASRHAPSTRSSTARRARR